LRGGKGRGDFRETDCENNPFIGKNEKEWAAHKLGFVGGVAGIPFEARDFAEEVSGIPLDLAREFIQKMKAADVLAVERHTTYLKSTAQ